MRPADPLVAMLQECLSALMHRTLGGVLGYARERGLSASQLGALLHIHRRGSSAVTPLADDLGITSSAASQMADRLVDQGLILRSEDPHDRRAKTLILTDKGLSVLQEGVRARQASLADLAASLTASERETVVAALRILIDRARRLRPPDKPGD